MRKVYSRTMPLLFAMMFFNYLDRINIGFAALDMNRALNFSPAVFGFAGSVFFVGYMLLEVPSNLLLHRVGARRWLARILITWARSRRPPRSCATIRASIPCAFCSA